MASRVCGITPSSAATTSTTMSVTFAPRARIRVNASWPGVSTNTTLFSPTCTLYAPMCCVIPPASPPATSASRIASSKLVFPWSTWPITVTTGGRGFRFSLVSSLATSRTISSSRDTTLTTPLNDCARSVAVDTSSAWLMLANTPRSSRFFSKSFARTSSFSASSRIVIPSVKVISRGARGSGGAIAAATPRLPEPGRCRVGCSFRSPSISRLSAVGRCRCCGLRA